MSKVTYYILPLLYFIIGTFITVELLKVLLNYSSYELMILIIPIMMLTVLLTVIGIVNSWMHIKKGFVHNYSFKELLWLYLRCWLVLICGISLAVVFYWLHDLLPETVRDLIHPLYVLFYIICGFLTFSSLLSIIWREDLKEIRLLNSENENQLLKAQLNPHFLYNTLNNIDALVWLDQERASKAVTSLSDLMRYLTYSSKQEKVTVGDEVAHLQQLIDLERLRVNNPNALIFDVSLENPDTRIAPLLMIPLVENCFKHCGDLGEDGAIKISIIEGNGELKFRTENNIIANGGSESQNQVKLSKGKKKGGVGLSVLRRRLSLLYPEQHLFTSKLDNGRYFATLILRISR